jgi:hypothetical protein
MDKKQGRAAKFCLAALPNKKSLLTKNQMP